MVVLRKTEKVDLETDHCWFELDENSFEDTSEEQTLDMTPGDVVKQFEAAAANWKDTDMSWVDNYDIDNDAE